MTLRPSPISCTIDLDKDGVHHGHLRLPYSHDESAWGAIMIPITVMKNGTGPTALLTGGNHGDEYEGPVSLFKLTNDLSLDQISGRVIIIPAMNYPAFSEAKRTSPIDKRNMNRVFPGKVNGTVTEKIADYFQRYLLPISDFVLDIHSGGKTLDFIPFAAVHVLGDKDQQAKCVGAMKAFCAPYSMMLVEIDSMGMYDNAAEDMGKIFVSTELGGGGSATAKSIAIADRGVRNFLKFSGILSGDLNLVDSINLDMPDDDCFVPSLSSGLCEPCVDLGSHVRKGDVLARVYNIHKTGVAPEIYYAKRDGLLTQRHFPGLVKMGDCLAIVADVLP